MSTQSVAQHKIEPVDEVLVNLLILVLTIAFCALVFVGGVYAFKSLFPITMTQAVYAMSGSVFFLAFVVIRNSIKKLF